MSKFSNNHQLQPTLLAYLASDRESNHEVTKDRPNVLRVTTLLKPLREVILRAQSTNMTFKEEDTLVEDATSRVAARIGQNVHTGIESVWEDGSYKSGLLNAGIPQSVVDSVAVNPPEPTNGIDVYLERRVERPIGRWIISGQLDCCFDGTVEDNKVTTVYSYKARKSFLQKTKIQLSIYRWLDDGNVITQDTGFINFIFKDWSKNQASLPDYPDAPALSHEVHLLSQRETSQFLKHRISILEKGLSETDQDKLPICSAEETWEKPSVWKYFSKKENVRATKNFGNAEEAYAALEQKGNVGKVVFVPGERTYCKNYCSARGVCKNAGDN